MSLTIVPPPETETIHPRDLIDACLAACIALTTHARRAHFEVVLLAKTADPLSADIALMADPAGDAWIWKVSITTVDRTLVATVGGYIDTETYARLVYLNTAHADRLPAVVERLERLTLPEVA